MKAEQRENGLLALAFCLRLFRGAKCSRSVIAVTTRDAPAPLLLLQLLLASTDLWYDMAFLFQPPAITLVDGFSMHECEWCIITRSKVVVDVEVILRRRRWDTNSSSLLKQRSTQLGFKTVVL